jgi:hypothetical protein
MSSTQLTLNPHFTIVSSENTCFLWRQMWPSVALGFIFKKSSVFLLLMNLPGKDYFTRNVTAS